jgi:major membrane immunogen (membrane-anchored lipoprotein)
MRKAIAVVIIAVTVLSLAVGCSKPTAQEAPKDGASYQDGTYVVMTNNIEDMGHGNYPFIKLTIKDKQVIDVDYREYLVELGEVKNDTNYKYPEAPKAAENLEKQLLEVQDPSKLDFDAVSGATHTKESFKIYALEALKLAQQGKTHKPIYKDGVYEAKASAESHGWLGQIKIVVEDGLIVGVDYDELAVADTQGKKLVYDQNGKAVLGSDGKEKTEPVQIKAGDEKSADNYTYPASVDAMKNFEKQLILLQDPAKLNFDAVSGATHTKENIVELAKEALKSAK